MFHLSKNVMLKFFHKSYFVGKSSVVKLFSKILQLLIGWQVEDGQWRASD